MDYEKFSEHNTEHYRDPTAAMAIEKLAREKEKQQLCKLVRECKKLAESFGFEICGRIPIKNKRTGWIYYERKAGQ